MASSDGRLGFKAFLRSISSGCHTFSDTLLYATCKEVLAKVCRLFAVEKVQLLGQNVIPAIQKRNME